MNSTKEIKDRFMGHTQSWAGIAVVSLCLAVGTASSAFAQAGFAFREEPGRSLEVLLDGKPVVSYMFAHAPSADPKSLTSTNKPYLHLFDRRGNAPVTNSGKDGEHPHHRGIMIGWTKTTYNGKLYNFWGMYNNAQIHRRFSVREAQADQAVFTSLIDWVTHEGETVIREARMFTVRRAVAPAYAQIDVTSDLTACLGDVSLDGDPEHAGVQFRAADAMDRTSALFAYPGEDVDPHKILDPPWVAAQFKLGNQVYSVVQINNPGNPPGARISAYRNYCRFGYFPRPVTVKSGQAYTLRYRFLAFEDKLPSAKTLQQTCNAYTGRSDAMPPVTVRPAEQPAPPKPKPVKAGELPQ